MMLGSTFGRIPNMITLKRLAPVACMASMTPGSADSMVS